MSAWHFNGGNWKEGSYCRYKRSINYFETQGTKLFTCKKYRDSSNNLHKTQNSPGYKVVGVFLYLPAKLETFPYSIFFTFHRLDFKPFLLEKNQGLHDPITALETEKPEGTRIYLSTSMCPWLYLSHGRAVPFRHSLL